MNLPNKLSITRMLLAPVALFLFLADTAYGGFIPYGQLFAIAVYIVAALTDTLDGAIARKYNMVTDLGKLLDPMGDKIHAFTGLLMIAIGGILTGTLPIWAVAVILFINLGRDFSVDTLRAVAATKGKVIAANWSGKLRTVIAFIAMPVLLFMCWNNSLAVPFIADVLKAILDITGYVLIGAAVVLNAYSWYYYFWDNRQVFMEKKVGE